MSLSLSLSLSLITSITTVKTQNPSTAYKKKRSQLRTKKNLIDPPSTTHADPPDQPSKPTVPPLTTHADPPDPPSKPTKQTHQT